MKILSFILILFLLFSCNNQKKIDNLIQKIDKNLVRLSKIQEADLSSKLAGLKRKAEAETRYVGNSAKAEEALNRVKTVFQNLENSLKHLDIQNTNQGYFEVYQNYQNWLRDKAKAWNFDNKEIAYYHKNKYPDFQKLLNISKDLKLQTQSRIYKETEAMFVYLGADDLFGGIVDYFRYAYVLAVNSRHFVEKGEEIELSQYVFMPHSRSDSLKNLIFKADINTGNIKRNNSIFEITIPTQKLGKQSFNMSVNVQNQGKTLDTTFHISKTFEIIK